MKNRLEAPDDVQAEFKAWCGPIRGTANPTIQTNIVWSWLIKTKAWPHSAHEAAGHGEKINPGWCFSRFGQSETKLPDGSVVYIGGEHEDFYDPDFYIYNDVIIVRPDESIEIYGYPEDVFPPTDSHSATVVDNCIYIIGCLGYAKQRDYSVTPVLRLNLLDWSMETVNTEGESPPRLFSHEAQYCEQSRTIICTEGKVAHEEAKSFVENITTWAFDLDTHTWERGSTKPYTRWLLVREDNQNNKLWEYEQVVYAMRAGKPDKFADGYRAKLEKLGIQVDVDLFEQRFCSAHSAFICRK